MNGQKIEGKKDLEKNALSDDQLDQVSGGHVLVIPTIPGTGHKRSSVIGKGLFEEDPDLEPIEPMHSMR